MPSGESKPLESATTPPDAPPVHPSGGGTPPPPEFAPAKPTPTGDESRVDTNVRKTPAEPGTDHSDLSRVRNITLLIPQPDRPPEKLVIELREPEIKKKPLQKFAGFFKGALPIVISIATALVAYYSYQLNARQSASTQADIRTKAIEDFIHEDPGKKTLGAIKLSQYEADALPVIRQTLGVSDPRIKEGALLTAEQMFKAPLGVSREQLLSYMLESFKEDNPTLSLGVLEFYLKVAPLLTNEESNRVVSLIQKRLGSDGSLCKSESGEFVLTTTRFVGSKSSPQAKERPGAAQLGEFKTLLLGIAEKCPWEKSPEGVDSPYEGARRQVATAIIDVARLLPAGERDDIVSRLGVLSSRADASPQFKESVTFAVGEIKKIQGP